MSRLALLVLLSNLTALVVAGGFAGLSGPPPEVSSCKYLADREIGVFRFYMLLELRQNWGPCGRDIFDTIKEVCGVQAPDTSDSSDAFYFGLADHFFEGYCRLEFRVISKDRNRDMAVIEDCIRKGMHCAREQALENVPCVRLSFP